MCSLVQQNFTIIKKHPSGSRQGILHTQHGDVLTPCFMAIASKGAVKSLTANNVYELQISLEEKSTPILLANTYHLFLQPGLPVIKKFKGLHNFIRWPGAILTDSGGFQIFSLAKLRSLSDKGVTFQSPLNGEEHLLTPEKSMEIQSMLKSDIWMVLDYFPAYPASTREAERSVQITTSWAKRCKSWFKQHKCSRRHKLFGIVQGGMSDDLRRQSAKEIVNIGFNGYAIGGLAIGEPVEEMRRVLKFTAPLLPEDAPRYLMGVGLPEQLLAAIKLGVDMFDCVIPTRNARHGSMFVQISKQLVDKKLDNVTYQRLNIRAAGFKKDSRPLSVYCRCNVCRTGVSRAFLRHLFMVKDPLAQHFATIHNLFFYYQLMKEIRNLI